MGVGGIPGGANSIANMMEQNAKTDAQRFQDTIQQEKVAEDQAAENQISEEQWGEVVGTAGLMMYTSAIMPIEKEIKKKPEE